MKYDKDTMEAVSNVLLHGCDSMLCVDCPFNGYAVCTLVPLHP